MKGMWSQTAVLWPIHTDFLQENARPLPLQLSSFLSVAAPRFGGILSLQEYELAFFFVFTSQKRKGSVRSNIFVIRNFSA